LAPVGFSYLDGVDGVGDVVEPEGGSSEQDEEGDV